MIQAAEVLEKITDKLAKVQGSELQEFLEKMKEKVRQDCTDTDYVYAQFAELKTLGYTAQQLFRDADDDSLHPRGDNWEEESLKPFLETLSTRLPALSQTFYRMVLDEGYQLKQHDTEKSELTPEEQAEREKKFNASWFDKCAAEMVKLRPEIEKPLKELIELTKAKADMEQTAEDTSTEGTRE